jgi:cytochrome oxidase Cu insertion factor (SCO1/SenC/PrrC family)
MLSFKRHRLLLAALVTGLLLIQGCGEDTATQNAAMEAAPDCSLALFDGGAFRLSDQKGKPVVIIYSAS